MKKLQADFYAGKEAARHAWSVDVSRVACRSFVEIVLKSVEHILYTCIDLHRIDVIDRKIIGQAASPLEEGGCLKRTRTVGRCCLPFAVLHTVRMDRC